MQKITKMEDSMNSSVLRPELQTQQNCKDPAIYGSQNEIDNDLLAEMNSAVLSPKGSVVHTHPFLLLRTSESGILELPLLEPSLLKIGSGLKTILKHKKLTFRYKDTQFEEQDGLGKNCDIESDLFDQAPWYSSTSSHPHSEFLNVQSKALEEIVHLQSVVSILSEIELDPSYHSLSQLQQKSLSPLYDVDEQVRLQSPVPNRPLQIVPFDEAWLKILGPHISSPSYLRGELLSVTSSTLSASFGRSPGDLYDFVLEEESSSCSNSSRWHTPY